MALPVAHLLCARLYAEKFRPEYKDSPEYYLGAIAPDAIHMRAGSNPEDKSATHLMTRGRMTDGEFMPPVLEFLHMHGEAPLTFGYALHVVTDRIWVEYYTSHCPGLSDANGRTISGLYYNDTEQVDYMLYHNRPERPLIWSQLSAARSADIAGLLGADEIDAWRSRTLSWFDGTKSSYSGEIRHLTYERITEFIQNSPERLNRSFSCVRALR